MKITGIKDYEPSFSADFSLIFASSNSGCSFILLLVIFLVNIRDISAMNAGMTTAIYDANV
ncbi:hypothetical protein [Acidiplasma cupricumulans]|uniref:hypothetical protein n=1 Tax=Acidiplasma cupricumulans TaxID=312540 RepID=UPI000AA29BB8|nr:hypothetical protein [Acidiplasma cupricumulans]